MRPTKYQSPTGFLPLSAETIKSPEGQYRFARFISL
jgi:hypothetical protein